MRNNKCTLCPRECQVNRSNGEKGFCGCSDELYVARAALHMWEEPCISGENGSGTVFFSGCTMKCVFCQNHNIADASVGKLITVKRLSEIFLELQDKGAHNINLVTPTHYTYQIIEALKLAKNNGLNIPIVYNTSGYEKVETLKKLNGLVDIYLPDMKYYSDILAKKYSNANNYFNIAKEALKEMYEQVGKPSFDENGMMKKGIIVRHLVLPNNIEDSKKVVKYIYETYGDNVYMSIMSQYTPTQKVKERMEFLELHQKIDFEKYEEVVDYAIKIGVENAFIQEEDVADESFIPDFNCEGV